MSSSFWVRCALVVLAVSLVGCPGPIDKSDEGGSEKSSVSGARAGSRVDTKETDAAPAQEPKALVSTASAEDVAAARKVIDGLGPEASCNIVSNEVLTQIVIQDGSKLTSDDIALFGRLTDLETLQILNFRQLDDAMVAELKSLKKLKSLALTNSVIGDGAVELIVESFPNLKVLDLSSNTNMTNSVLKVICQLSDLERLALVQNRINDLGTGNLAKLKKLKVLDLRGNMEAGDMTLEVVGVLPSLVVFKHRSTTVSDYGIECLAASKTLKSILMQDFNITGQAGQYIAQMESLRELEVFRCQGFGSDGVQAFKGMKLTRLQLRDLPVVDDQAMVVFEDLPELKKLYLHENDSISDEGLKNLANLKSLEVLDIWAISQMGDATVDVIATLPNLKQLTIRTTAVTDAAVDNILAMPKLESLTFKENGSVSDEALKKLSGKTWKKLDIGQ